MSGPVVRESGGLADVIDRILDKGLVLNADISVSVGGTELLGVKITATIASFETAARYGLEFPSGTNLNAPIWKKSFEAYANCPECGNRRTERLLIDEGCPVCGWESPLKKKNVPVLKQRSLDKSDDSLDKSDDISYKNL